MKTPGDLFEKYAILDAEEKELKSRKESLRVDILKAMAQENIESATSSFGKFTISKLKKWTYTEKVQELEEKYKARKAKEESTGEAEYEEVESLRFTALKI